MNKTAREIIQLRPIIVWLDLYKLMGLTRHNKTRLRILKKMCKKAELAPKVYSTPKVFESLEIPLDTVFTTASTVGENEMLFENNFISTINLLESSSITTYQMTKLKTSPLVANNLIYKSRNMNIYKIKLINELTGKVVAIKAKGGLV